MIFVERPEKLLIVVANMSEMLFTGLQHLGLLDIVSLSKGEVLAGQRGGRGKPPTKSLWSSGYGGGELANT